MITLKQIIKKILLFFNFKIIKINYKELNFDDIYKIKIKDEKPVIFDVGANQGQSIVRFKKIFPKSIIHAFEPNTIEFKKLILKFKNDKSIILNNCGVGDKKEIKELLITKVTGNSSFYKLNLDTQWIKIRSNETTVSEKKYTSGKQRVIIKTLDQYCKEKKIKKINLLKIDTQGYEDKVLSGSKSLLNKNIVQIIETEIMFDDVYKKYLNFIDIEKYLIPNNFRFCGYSKNGSFNNLFEGHTFFADLLYLNKKYFFKKN